MWNGDAQKREKVRRCCFCGCLLNGNGQSSCSGANRIDLSLTKQLFAPIRPCTMTKCCTLQYHCAISRDTKVPAKLDVLQQYDLWFTDRNFNRPHALREVTLALSVFQMSVIFRRVISQSIKRSAFLFVYVSWNSLLQSWRYMTSCLVTTTTGMTFPFLFEDATWYTYLPF